MKTKWILCDLGQTLIKFDHQLAARNLRDTLERDGKLPAGSKAPDLDELHEFFFAEDDHGRSLNLLLDSGECGMHDVAARLRSIYHINATDQDVLVAWQSIFTETVPKTFDAMKRARAKGVKVGICSNTNRAHWEAALEQFPELTEIYDDIFLSFRLGCVKNDPAFFRRIPYITGCRPEEHVLLDDLRENIYAAEKAGCRGVHFEEPLPSDPAWD